MTSVGSHILNHTRTGGHFIGIAVSSPATAAYWSAYTAPTSSTTGFLNAAGSTFNFGATSGSSAAANACAAAVGAFATSTSITTGMLFEDMGDRITFSAAGQTIAIFAKVRLLNDALYEGTETPVYVPIWVGAPGGTAGTSAELVVGVARL